MKNNYKRTIAGVSCLLFTACSTLSDLGIPDLTSMPTSIPTTEDISGSLDSSRIEGAMNLAKAATLTNEEVVNYARSFSKQEDSKNKVAPASNPYSVRLNRLVSKHIKEDGLNLNFKVYLSPEVNAFAMADGTVRVYSGLMDTMKDDELLFVIGHEIGHVKKEHVKSQIQKAYATHALISTGASELQANTGNTLGGAAGRVGIEKAEGILADLAEAQFSQGDEEEADDYGLSFTKKHNYSKDAGIRALYKLAEVGDKNSSLVEDLFSSHPDSEERAHRLEKQLGVAALQSTPDEETSETQSAVIDESSEEIELVAEEPAEEVAFENRSATQDEVTPVIPTNIQPAIAQKSYAIQVEAAGSKTKAEETLANFNDSGFEGTIQTAEVNGSFYFRVLIGSFKSFSEAKANLFEIQNTGLSDGQPFIQKVQNN